MGLSENAAKRGLYHTGNSSADTAASWVFEHLEDTDLHTPFIPEAHPIRTPFDETLKMVFVVNTSLKMGVGKISAQVGHATLALYKTLLIYDTSEGNDVDEWERGGAKKIVLKGVDAKHLYQLQEEAAKKKVSSFMVADAGKKNFSINDTPP